MAMNMDAALRITAKVDGANNITSLNRSLQAVEGTAKGLTGAMRGLAGASAGLSGALGALAPLASIAGLVGLAKGSLDAGDKMFDLAQKTGVSVEALARFKKAASTSGTDIDSVSKALVKLSKGMVEAAATGKGKAADSLKALGLSATDASGKLKGADQVTLEIANRFKSMADGPVKAALAVNLFGKAGADMIPLLNMGGQAIDKLSVKMTTAFAQKADEYSDKLTALSGKVGAFGADLLIALLPALDAVTDAVSGAVSAFNALPALLKNVVVGGTLIAIAWGPLAGLVKATTGAFVLGQAALQGFQLQMKLAAMEGIPLLNAAIMSIPLAGWAIAAVAALAALGTALYLNNKGFKDWADTSLNFIKVLASDGIGTMRSFGQWLGQMWNGLVKAAQNVGAGIARAFGGPFGVIGTVAQSVFDFVGQKIQGIWNMLPEGLRKSVGGVGNYFQGAWSKAAGMTAAGGKGSATATTATGDGGFVPDMAALGSGAATGGAGRRDGARPRDNGEALARTREGLLLDGMMADKRADYVQTQRQINDLILGQNTASEAGNALLALQIEGRRVMLESGLEQVKLQEDTNRKLAESATNQDQQNKGLRDAVILAELNATVTERQEATRLRLAEVDQQIAAQRKKDASEQLDLERERAVLLAESMARMTELTTRNSVGAGAQQGIQAYVDSIGNLRDAVGQLTTNAIGGLEESLASLATTGTANFREFAASILKETTRMIIRQLILKSIMQLIGGIGGSATAKSFEMPNSAFIPSGGYKFADGGAFANGIVPFANGGIVSSPTLFKFAKGGGFNTGLMSESGPEAIMPLRRGADGKLGVASSGGGSTTINISVDAKGSSVQGDNGQSAALARAIAGAVQTELIKQKRPGGILTS